MSSLLHHPSPLWQLFLMRMRTLVREPSALFWVFVFPLLMSVALGLAFRNQGSARLSVAVVDAPELATRLSTVDGLSATPMDRAAAREALRRGKVALLLEPGPTLVVDPTQPEGRTARLLVADALQRFAGRQEVIVLRDEKVSAPGARYIDFLIPGLLGFSVMSSSIWGLGWGLVQMRMGKLLKRLVATPMRRSTFLLSFALGRIVLITFEVFFFMGFARLLFDVRVAGSALGFLALSLVGALSFAGMALLVASRAQNSETAGGLMNLVTLPMTVLSGVFFSASHFPAWMQPALKLLPLTALNDGLRAISIDGSPLSALLGPLVVLLVWGLGTFGLALRIFRWT